MFIRSSASISTLTTLRPLNSTEKPIDGVKRIVIASGLRYDLAMKDPEYIKELLAHHVGGCLKIAPEHSEDKTLSKMIRPGISAYDEFKRLSDLYSKSAGKK